MDKFNFFVLIKILFNNNKSDIEKILTENLTVSWSNWHKWVAHLLKFPITRLVPFNLQFNYFIAVLFGYGVRYTAYHIS